MEAKQETSTSQFHRNIDFMSREINKSFYAQSYQDGNSCIQVCHIDT